MQPVPTRCVGWLCVAWLCVAVRAWPCVAVRGLTACACVAVRVARRVESSVSSE